SSGLPLAVSVPSTTQLFDPIASARELPNRSAATVGSPDDSARSNASLHWPGEPGWADRSVEDCAACAATGPARLARWPPEPPGSPGLPDLSRIDSPSTAYGGIS